MPTYNPKLEHLTIEEINEISTRYLMGWHDLYEYGFRVKGLNRKRLEHGLEPLNKEWSLEYRIQYIQNHYSKDEIVSAIAEYLGDHNVDETRWSGIEILDCRFGRNYATAFRKLIGSSLYRKISEETRVKKLCETQELRYGGIGMASKELLEKSVQTNIMKYGAENAMQNDDIKKKLAVTNNAKYGGDSPFCSKQVRDKASESKLSHVRDSMNEFQRTGVVSKAVFKQSPSEMIVFYELIGRFGKKDVYYQYGIHPYDARYPFSCDFYIKSLDLFIEINAHYSHGDHWFDENSHDDALRRTHLMQSDSRRSRISVDTWCVNDLKKREKAKLSNINYLVFWDGSVHHENKEVVPNLKDFYEWFYEYDCDYDRFVHDHPENSY